MTRLEKLTGRRRIPAVPEPLLVDRALEELERKYPAAGWGELVRSELYLVAEQELEQGLAGVARRILEELRAERELELKQTARGLSALVLEVRA